MDAHDLKFFHAVAQSGGMNRATARLNTVQSNITARIRALEAELGVPLFDRHSCGVALTAAGRRLLPYAEHVDHLLAEAKRAVCDDGVPSGPLTLGTLETTAAIRLAPVLSGFIAEFPKVDLSLRTGTSRELVSDVISRRVEGAFVCGPVKSPELTVEAIFQEELVLFSSPHVTTWEAALNTADLRIIVLKAGCSYRERLERFLATRGLVAPRLLEFGTLEAIVSSVIAGMGVTLLPEAMIGKVAFGREIGVHRLPNGVGRVDTVFIRRSDAFISSALSAFLKPFRAAHAIDAPRSQSRRPHQRVVAVDRRR